MEIFFLCEGQILAVWILAAKLPNSDMNFAVDVWVEFLLLLYPRKNIQEKIPCKIRPKCFFFGRTPFWISAEAFFSVSVKWGMGWVVVGTAVSGAPRLLAKIMENTAFFDKKMQNRGTPKTAVHTTTHPIPHLTRVTSYL